MAEVSKPAIIIMILISVLFLAALLPTIVENIQGTNSGPYTGDFGPGRPNTTSIWWNFTGYSGAATLWLIIPLLIVAGAALGFVKDLIT